MIQKRVLSEEVCTQFAILEDRISYHQDLSEHRIVCSKGEMEGMCRTQADETCYPLVGLSMSLSLLRWTEVMPKL